MNKPQGYDEAQAFGEFETLPAGGYKCIIKKVACETTQAGKEYLNKNGVVKDRKVHAKVIEKIALFAHSLKFEIQKIDFSPIKGPAGNIEYLMYMKKEDSIDKLDLFILRKHIQDIVEKSHKELK